MRCDGQTANEPKTTRAPCVEQAPERSLIKAGPLGVLSCVRLSHSWRRGWPWPQQRAAAHRAAPQTIRNSQPEAAVRATPTRASERPETIPALPREEHKAQADREGRLPEAPRERVDRSAAA